MKWEGESNTCARVLAQIMLRGMKSIALRQFEHIQNLQDGKLTDMGYDIKIGELDVKGKPSGR